MKNLMDTNWIDPEESFPQIHTHVVRNMEEPSIGPELYTERHARIVKGYVEQYGAQGYLINSWNEFRDLSFVVCVEIDRRNCALVGCNNEVIPHGLNVVKEYYGDEPNLFLTLNKHWQNDSISIVFGPNIDTTLMRDVLDYYERYKLRMPFLVLSDGEVS